MASASSLETPVKSPHNNKKYSILGILISKCFPMLLRKHVEKHVNSCKPYPLGSKPWTLDDFLYVNIAATKRPNTRGHRCVLNQSQQKILFPGHNKTTDIEQWDLTLLCLIIIEYCEPSPQLRCDVEQMRCIRHEFVHIGDPNISMDEYTRKVDKIKILIERGLEELGDSDFEKEITETIADVENSRLIVEDIFFSVKERFNHKALQNSFQGTSPEANQKNTKTLEIIESKLSTSDSSLPLEIRRMDKRSIEIYKDALTNGKEPDHSIRVMVVGHSGVGKTTLTKRLLDEDGDLLENESTDGIEIHQRKCRVNLENGEWTKLREDEILENYKTRQRLVLNKHLKDDSKQNELQKENEALTYSINDTDDGIKNTEIEIIYKRINENKETEIDKKNEVNQQADDRVSETLPKSGEKEGEKDLEEVISSDAPILENTAELSIWDFAGQYVYYCTHHIFLSRRAIYLLVTDITEDKDSVVNDEDDDTSSVNDTVSKLLSEYIQFWLNSIHCNRYIPDTSIVPSVLLVGTHAGKGEDMVNAHFESIWNILKDETTKEHIVDDDSFPVENKEKVYGHEALKHKIVEVAQKQSYWGQPIPCRWVKLEQKLDKMRDKGYKMIKRTQLDEINKNLFVPLEQEELGVFLEFHHSCGNLVYYKNEPSLNENILLDPQWLVDALKCLISSSKFNKKLKLHVEWNNAPETGCLTDDLIGRIWKHTDTENKTINSAMPDGNKIESFYDNRNYLICLLETFNVIAKPKKNMQDTDKTTEEDNCYFVPCLVKESPQEEDIKKILSGGCETTSTLCFKGPAKLSIHAIYTKLLTSCMNEWELAKCGEKYLIYSGCGIFYLDDSKIYRLSIRLSASCDRAIQIMVSSRSKDEFDLSRSQCAKNIILKNLSQGIFKEYVLCPKCKTEIDVEKIHDIHEYVCDLSDDGGHLLKPQELLQYWYEGKKHEPKRQGATKEEWETCKDSDQDEIEGNPDSDTGATNEDMESCKDSDQDEREGNPDSDTGSSYESAVKPFKAMDQLQVHDSHTDRDIGETKEGGETCEDSEQVERKGNPDSDTVKEYTSSPDLPYLSQPQTEMSQDHEQQQVDASGSRSEATIGTSILDEEMDELQDTSESDTERDFREINIKATNYQQMKKNPTIPSTYVYGDKHRWLYKTGFGKERRKQLHNTSLEMLCKRYGRKSRVVSKRCDSICEYIRSCSRLVVHVMAAYQPANENEVVFVVFTAKGATKPTRLPVDRLNIVFREYGMYSNENRKVMKHLEDLNISIPKDEVHKVEGIIQREAPTLMKQHKNLNIITACPMISREYGNDTEYVKQTCIVLFVETKGVIPIQEEEFPKFIAKFPVDVREGGFEFYGFKANEYHAKLKMGCLIGCAGKGGTLGGFVDLPGGEVGCVTSAHVVLNDNDMKKLVKEQIIETVDGSGNILQPVPYLGQHFGVVKKAVYSDGSDEEGIGVEVAFILITDLSRIPENGGFPDADFSDTGFSASNPMLYLSGDTYSSIPKNAHQSTVYKFGAETSCTRGAFNLQGPSVRTSPPLKDDYFGICLNNQLQMVNVGCKHFAKHGDSGALVLIAHEGNTKDLRAIGILTGGLNDGTLYFVTPIWAIQKALGMAEHAKMKEFPVLSGEEACAMETDEAKGTDEVMRNNTDTLQQLHLYNQTDTANEYVKRHLDVHENKTKKEISEFKEEVKEEINGIKGEMKVLKGELHSKLDTILQHIQPEHQ